MHELSYMIRLADIAICEIEKHPELSPETVVARVGELTGVLPHYLQKYYLNLRKGTLLENVSLEIEGIAAEAACGECGFTYHPDKSNDYRCPACGSIKARFLHGRELAIKEIRFKSKTGKDDI